MQNDNYFLIDEYYMELRIKIYALETDLSLQARSDNILAFVTWIFKTDIGDIKIKGGTIRRKEFGSKSLLSYDVPAIKTRHGYNKAFFMDNKELFLKLSNFTIQKYCEESGEPVSGFSNIEDINPDEIPI